MPKDRAVKFFKKLFKRKSESGLDIRRTCHTCNVALESESIGPRTLERCPGCRGIWLGQSQLEEILEQVGQNQADPATESAVASDGHAGIPHTLAPSRLPRACPECEQPMENFKFEETGVWIDGCSEGHGIWLDNGELRLISQRAKGKDAAESDDNDTILDAVSDLILGNL